MFKGLIKEFFKMFGYELKKISVAQIPFMVRRIRQMIYMGRMYDKILYIEGDIVECGVGRGTTFLFLSTLAEAEGRGRMVWGFDSFEGFPEPAREDASFRNPKKGEWSGTSIVYIRDILITAGITKDFLDKNIRLVKGFFEKSLGSYKGGPIAFLHIDVDLHDSYKTVLRDFFPKVAKGGVILFDEYKSPKWPGATKAIDEFFQDTSYVPKFDALSGKYFVVK